MKKRKRYIEKVTNIKIIPLPYHEENYGIAVSKNNWVLKEKVNEQLENLRKDTEEWEDRLELYELKEFESQKQK